MAQEKVRVLWNKEVGPSYMHIGLEGEKSPELAMAGQFVMLKADNRIDPLLRRPFSIHQVIKKDGKVTGIELLYKVVGTITERLAAMHEGDEIDLVGPLGKGFQILPENKKVFIAAGGIGVAPVVFLASRLIEEGINPSDCTVFLGGRTSNDVLCADFFNKLGMTVLTATDDGSSGHKGLVTDLVIEGIENNRPDIMYTCGPHPMLMAVADIANNSGIKCQLSTETLMACGMGACLGCAVEDCDNSNEYMHVCINGPVFYADKIKL